MESVRSPEAATPSDPFELERLAEELAQREASPSVLRLTFPTGADRLTTAERTLPIHVPLSHDNPHLRIEHFDVDAFLLSRVYTSLPDLRAELRDYLAKLKEELVKLINDDYEAFISLSTDLRGEGARLERIKYPLKDLKAQVLEARQSLQTLQDSTEHKLNQRAEIREEKAFLHLLLKISDSITRLESLLLISSPSDTPSDLPGPSHLEEAADREDRIRGNRAKHLARVAAEYTQLLYHVFRAKEGGGSAFIDESQWRIDRIQSTLSSDLDHLFATTLSGLSGSGSGSGSGFTSSGKTAARAPASDLEKPRLLADLSECLRTYDVLGLWRDAEDVLRREFVRSFVKKTIHPGALSAPHSPILPHTPFAPASSSARPTSPAPPTATHPRTPYTPFTAFASKQNPFTFSLQASTSAPNLSVFATNGAPAPHMLDDRDDPLAALYNVVLRFVDRDLKRIMEIAEGVCAKSGTRARAVARAETQGGQAGGKVDIDGPAFEIMANVVWAEVGQAIMDELGSVVFAAGKPDDFRNHHETTHAFVRALEFLAPSVHAIATMRSHPVYAAFERRWQLPVYFQLRWKEIVTGVEDALAVTRIERGPNTKSLAPFVTTQAATVWDAISTCWSAQVYIPALCHRFWKLTLQLLHRYKTWLDSGLPPLEPPAKVAAAVAEEKAGLGQKSPAGLPRAATPNPPAEAASAESTAADEMLLQQFATAIIDICAMEAQVMSLWREEISAMLPDVDVNTSEGEFGPEDVLKHALSTLTSLIPPLSSQIITILSRRACDALLPMRSIPSQFRAMSASTSKRMPNEPSYFITLIFRPVRAFFGVGAADGAATSLKDKFMQSYAEEVFELVTQRYIYFLSAMKKTEESLRRLKKGKKSTFSLFGGTAKDDEGRADEEKIRAQMILDVEAFGKDAESLGVIVQQSETFKVLRDMAGSTIADDL